VKTWQLQEAKAKFSQLVEKAMKGEPQLVTKHGEKAVVVLDYQEYEKLGGQGMSVWEALRRHAPRLEDDEVDALFTRDKSTHTGREVDFELDS